MPGSARAPVTSESLRFQTRRRVIAFYDKRAEIVRSGGTVPAEWGGAYVLRYELRYLKDTTRAFGRSLYASDLWDRAFHADLVRRWERRFGTVRSARPLLLAPATSVRSLRDRLALRGVKDAGGLPSVLDSIDAARASGTVTSDAATRMRQWVRRVTSDPTLTGDPDLGRELSGAVRAAALNSLPPTQHDHA